MYNPEAKDVDMLREYSPMNFALFSRYENDPTSASLNKFQRIATQHRKDAFESGIKCHFLRYGGVDDRQLVDVFYNECTESKPSPLFVFIHGGYWQFWSKEVSASMVGPLVKNGYRVAIVDYNVCPTVTVPQLMEELSGLATWIFDYADRTNTTDIIFAGHSTGAHLLSTLLHIPDSIPESSRAKIKTMFFLTGIYDAREVWLLSPINTDNLWGLDEESAMQVSPILWPWKDAAQMWGCLQIHVLSVEHTSVTFQEQSQQFSQVLEAAGFNTTFKLFDGLDHFTIILDQNLEKNEITNYIKAAMQKACSGPSKESNRPCTCASKR